ncbi:MAG: helix-turn-helix transcriptional regulator [Yoonia sp.]|uniref:helix-turn-helix transcriptional regulator n=1 Tax=Yoonia sp. TaxID=2212373 RepID=UPI003EF2EF3A
MTDLGQYLEQLTNARSVEELWALHTEQMQAYGFDRLIYGHTRYRTSSSLGDPQDWVVLTTHTPEYMDVFLDKGLYHDAPMVRWALDNDGACSWSWVREKAQTEGLTPAEVRVLEFNKSMDVNAGYTVSFRSLSERTKAAIALTAKRGVTQEEADAVWAQHGADIVVMNNVMHLKLMTLPYAGARRLTRRQREVLQWVGDGKTTQDIAVLLNLKPATVEKHLRLARETLDVQTTAQAVLKAAFYNQMFVFEAEL